MIRLVIGGHDCSCATVLSGERDLWASHLCSTYSYTKYKRSSSDFQFKQTILTIVWHIVYVIFELVVQSYYKREKRRKTQAVSDNHLVSQEHPCSTKGILLSRPQRPGFDRQSVIMSGQRTQAVFFFTSNSTCEEKLMGLFVSERLIICSLRGSFGSL